MLDLLGCNASAEVVVLAARLTPQKGQIDLLEAAPRVLADRPAVRIAFVGGESWPWERYEDVLRTRASELGILDCVSFLGQLKSGAENEGGVIRFLAGCDLLAAPSQREVGSGWKEGFGLSPVEAMSVRTPVVAYRHGSFPEVLGDCARFVPEGDTEALSHAIIEVLRDEDLRREMIACGEKRVLAYRPEINLDGMKRVYQEVSGLGDGPGSDHLPPIRD